MRYPVMNLGQQVAPAARQRLPCPPLPAPDPKLNCVFTRDGGVICSDGTYYPPYCSAPPVAQGKADYVQQGPFLFPQPPPEHSLTTEVGGVFPWLAVGIAAAGGLAAAIFS